ncbi:MAG: MBL fold metallo-hydrolase [Desulfosudaceae bacterium]
MNLFKPKQYGQIEAWEAGFGPLGPPLMTVHVFLVGGVLIDTGQSRMRSAIIGALAEKPIDLILLTHHHEDHSGNAGCLKRDHDVPVLGHPVTVEKMKQRYPILPYQQYTWGKADPVRVDPLPDMVEAGQLRLRPVHAPGHSRDHTVFLEENQGWLFAGDLYLGDRIKYFRADESMTDQISSLEKVLKLDFEWLLCAHNPRPGQGKVHLRRKLDYLLNLRGEITALIQKGYSEKAIINRLKDRETRLIRLLCMGNVSFANMIRATVREYSVQT